ncbi:MAG: hypothetical protein AAGF47_05865 [Planctomycetota bacterium]
MTRRGFVMPVVVLLALVGGLVVGVVLTRASQRAVITQAQLDAYRDAHREFGMKSIITSWINYSQSTSVEELTGGGGEGGKAFRTELPSGDLVEASFFPAQAAVLIEPAAQDGQGARIVRAMRDLDLPDTRPVGPLSVDAARASQQTIASLLAAALQDDELAADLASDIVRTRRDGEIARSELDAVMNELGLEPDARRMAERVLTAEPSLWRVRTVYTPRRLGRAQQEPVVYEGYVDLPDGRVESSTAISSNEVFLSWYRVDERRNTAPGARGAPG